MPSTSATTSSTESGGPRELSSPVNRPFWLCLRWVVKTLLRPIFHLRGFSVSGASRLPRHRRPMIVVANHAAFIDSVYLILAMPVRFTICGAKPRLFRSGVLRAAMTLANILQVKSHDQFLEDCKNLLDRGEVLLIYPEMGRTRDRMGPFKPWAAEVALATGADVLPCYLYGTTAGQNGAVELRIGNILDTQDFVQQASGSTLDETATEGDMAGLLTAHLRKAIEDLSGMHPPPEGKAV